MSIKLLLFVITFLMQGYGSSHAKDLHEQHEGINPKVEIDNPYKTVDWDKAIQIRSTSHVHLLDQGALNRAEKLGYRHLPISNYYPSAPYYPIESMRQNQFRVKQDFGAVRIVDGEPQYIDGPIDWNKIIMDKETGWYDSLTVAQQEELPFTVGEPIFTEIPDNIIFSPNAEHHSFANVSGNVHVNTLGSLYSSGTFDARNRFKTYYDGGGYSFGAGLTWQDSFEKIFDQLLFEDGGGVTINHPTWSNEQHGGDSNLPQSLIEEMLDFDERVLGIEVLTQGSWSLEMWDNILKTGRKCFGFFVPDWAVSMNEPLGGFNVLLLDDFTEHACLKAYRDGAFFGSQFGGTDLIFNKIALEDDELRIEVNSKSNITIITDKGSSEVGDSKQTTYKIPLDVNNTPTIKYIRVEAENGNERIFSQPIRFIVNL